MVHTLSMMNVSREYMPEKQSGSPSLPSHAGSNRLPHRVQWPTVCRFAYVFGAATKLSAMGYHEGEGSAFLGRCLALHPSAGQDGVSGWHRLMRAGGVARFSAGLLAAPATTICYAGRTGAVVM